MKAEELKLTAGNIAAINVFGRGDTPVGTIKASALTFTDLYNYKDFTPVKLSDEWFKRFGFEYRMGGYENGIRFEHVPEMDCYHLDLGNPLLQAPFIKYVHQLQNLYFCLIQEELLAIPNKIIRYSLIGKDKAGVKDHPQDDMEKMGVKVLKYEGVPIGDCVIMEVENLPEKLPDYIEIIDSFEFTE